MMSGRGRERTMRLDGTAAPSIEGLKDKILRRELIFPGVFQHIMRTLLHHPDIVAFGTTKSVAGSCAVSTIADMRTFRRCAGRSGTICAGREGDASVPERAISASADETLIGLPRTR
jgi:hypothetical protein